MRWGVVTFPGSLDDRDTVYVIEQVLGDSVTSLWHKDSNLHGVDCVILPGGFSYGDYLRPGAMARFSPVMRSVIEHAQAGGLVLGICNGFQILCEAGLLPGALVRNRSLRFLCGRSLLRVERDTTPFTSTCRSGMLLDVPIKHGEGCYVADERTLDEWDAEGRVLFRYVDAEGKPTEAANPNGSLRNIAGIVNAAGNILGMMPHPEHACEDLLGGADGLRILQGIRGWSMGDGARVERAAT